MMTFKYEITSLVFCIFLTKCCPAGQTLDIHSNNKCISSSHEESNSSTVYVTDSNEEKTVGENLLYLLILMNVNNIILSFQCLGENLENILLAAKDPILTLLVRPVGIISTLEEFL